MTIDDIACEFYVDWCKCKCKGSGIETEEQARQRFVKMPYFGRRAFVSLAYVAVRIFAPKSVGAEQCAALRNIECACGDLNCGGGMACASRGAE